MNKLIDRDTTQEIIYKVSISKFSRLSFDDKKMLEQYKFKDKGYLVLCWQYKHKIKNNSSYNWHGYVTEEALKTIIGMEQYAELLEGKREFFSSKVK